MILTGSEIKKQWMINRIHILPFIEKNLNPNSYNFRLGNKLKVYKHRVLDAKEKNIHEDIIIPPEGMVLQPNQLYP